MTDVKVPKPTTGRGRLAVPPPKAVELRTSSSNMAQPVSKKHKDMNLKVPDEFHSETKIDAVRWKMGMNEYVMMAVKRFKRDYPVADPELKREILEE